MNKPDKKTAYQKCLDVVEQRISHAQAALDSATEAVTSESKSTVGDKHETARAMAQIEQENAGRQLHEAQDLKNALLKIDTDLQSQKAVAGSLVVTDKTTFFISVAAGKIEAEGKTVLALSPASPVGQKLLGLTARSSFEFNGQKYNIIQVY